MLTSLVGTYLHVFVAPSRHDSTVIIYSAVLVDSVDDEARFRRPISRSYEPPSNEVTIPVLAGGYSGNME